MRRVHHSHRLDAAQRRGALAILIAEPHFNTIATGCGHCRQHAKADRRPRIRERDGDRRQRAQPPSQSTRHQLIELGLHAQRHFVVLCAATRRRAQCHRHRDRLVVIEQERRRGRAGAKAIAAAAAGRSVDDVANLTSALDVAADGAAGDLQTVSEFGAGPFAPDLEQRQEAQHAGRGRTHRDDDLRGLYLSSIPALVLWLRACRPRPQEAAMSDGHIIPISAFLAHWQGHRRVAC